MKIPQDKRIRTYELTYLVSTGLSSDESKAVVDQVEKLIKKYKGKIVKTEDWGKKTLAYTIQHGGKKYLEADYKHLKIEMETNQIQLFNRDVQLNQHVLRHLLVIEEGIDFEVGTSTAEGQIATEVDKDTADPSDQDIPAKVTSK